MIDGTRPTFGSLFAGIGGFDLGLERAGWSPRWQVEIDERCRQVLAKHWPSVDRFVDVHFVGRDQLAPVDLIAGGFPCQDLSPAGKRVGLSGARSGLWREFRRILGELRPRFALIENVHATWRRWLPVVRSDLAALRYRSLPIRLRASDFGAPHQRARVFVVAAADAAGARSLASEIGRLRLGRASRTRSAADAAVPQRPRAKQINAGIGAAPPDADEARELEPRRRERTVGQRPCDCGWWLVEPAVDRVVHGLSAGVDRAARESALGNAIVPQAAEWIGAMIREGCSA